MFDGLALMNGEELAEITRLIGQPKPSASREILHEIILRWLARAVKKEGQPPAEIERAVLEWTAEAFKIPVEGPLATDDLERAIRRRIAQDAADYLAPSWTIICALVAVGKADAIERKLSLLEQAASMAVPSQTALRERRAQWEQLCRRWSGSDPMEEIRPSVQVVAQRSELGVECLTLGLSLSLLDGGIGFPTERLFREVAGEFGLDRAQSDQLQKKVNDLYWKHHNASHPSGVHPEASSDPVAQAARMTVYQAGALEALATDARARLFASLESGKRSGWSRWMGSLSGLSPFFSDKMKDRAQATLARLVYHTIVKQHLAVAAARAEERAKQAEEQARARQAAQAAERPTPFTAPPTEVDELPLVDFAAPSPLAEKVEQPTVKRVIKLDL